MILALVAVLAATASAGGTAASSPTAAQTGSPATAAATATPAATQTQVPTSTPTVTEAPTPSADATTGDGPTVVSAVEYAGRIEVVFSTAVAAGSVADATVAVDGTSSTATVEADDDGDRRLVLDTDSDPYPGDTVTLSLGSVAAADGNASTVESAPVRTTDGVFGEGDENVYAGAPVAVVADGTNRTVAVDGPNTSITTTTGPASEVAVVETRNLTTWETYDVTVGGGEADGSITLVPVDLTAQVPDEPVREDDYLTVTITARTQTATTVRLRNESGAVVRAVERSLSYLGSVGALLATPAPGNYSVSVEDRRTGTVVDAGDLTVTPATNETSENESDAGPAVESLVGYRYHPQSTDVWAVEAVFSEEVTAASLENTTVTTIDGEVRTADPVRGNDTRRATFVVEGSSRSSEPTSIDLGNVTASDGTRAMGERDVSTALVSLREDGLLQEDSTVTLADGAQLALVAAGPNRTVRIENGSGAAVRTIDLDRRQVAILNASTLPTEGGYRVTFDARDANASQTFDLHRRQPHLSLEATKSSFGSTEPVTAVLEDGYVSYSRFARLVAGNGSVVATERPHCPFGITDIEQRCTVEFDAPPGNYTVEIVNYEDGAVHETGQVTVAEDVGVDLVPPAQFVAGETANLTVRARAPPVEVANATVRLRIEDPSVATFGPITSNASAAATVRRVDERTVVVERTAPIAARNGSNLTLARLPLVANGTGRVTIGATLVRYEGASTSPPPTSATGTRVRATAAPLVDGTVPGSARVAGVGERRVDMNANRRIDSDDVVTYFLHMDDPSMAEHPRFFDLNGNDRVDFDDVVVLFGAI